MAKCIIKAINAVGAKINSDPRINGKLMQTPSIELPASLVWCDPERLGGKPCFRGTPVPVDALFGNLEAGVSLDEFLDAFEGVTREQAIGVLDAARAAVAVAEPV